MSHVFGNLCYHIGTVCEMGGGLTRNGNVQGGGGDVRTADNTVVNPNKKRQINVIIVVNVEKKLVETTRSF